MPLFGCSEGLHQCSGIDLSITAVRDGTDEDTGSGASRGQEHEIRYLMYVKQLISP